MASCFADKAVGDLVRQEARRARVLEDFGIDYCCGGQQSLSAACERAGVPVQDVCYAIAACDEQERSPAEERDWSRAPLAELADHIVERHHHYLRDELPRLRALIERVCKAHGQSHPELWEVRRVFWELQNELTMHMMKEERVLFPITKALESTTDARMLPAFHCGSVANPIAVMEDEHRHAGDALARLRSLTHGYHPPADACESYFKLLVGLATLEADMHLHIHKENNILFPRAAELERTLWSQRTA